MGTHYKGTQEEVRALNAYIKLMRAADSVTSRLSALLSDVGLTVSQFGLLEALLHLGPMCQSVIGKKLLKSGGNITTVVDNLERRGLVARKRDENDRRFVTVHLTEAGRRLISDLFPTHAAAITKEMNVLTAAEQEELGRLCRKLGLRKTTIA